MSLRSFGADLADARPVNDAVMALRRGERVLLLAYDQSGARNCVDEIVRGVGSDLSWRTSTQIETQQGGRLWAFGQNQSHIGRGISVDRFICVVDEADLDPNVMAAIKPCMTPVEKKDTPVEIEHLKRVRLEDGDTLVVKLPDTSEVEVCERIRRSLKKYFPKNEVLVFADDVTLAVLGKDSEGSDVTPQQVPLPEPSQVEHVVVTKGLTSPRDRVVEARTRTAESYGRRSRAAQDAITALQARVVELETALAAAQKRGTTNDRPQSYFHDLVKEWVAAGRPEPSRLRRKPCKPPLWALIAFADHPATRRALFSRPRNVIFGIARGEYARVPNCARPIARRLLRKIAR